jgi:hypothetical protein
MDWRFKFLFIYFLKLSFYFHPNETPKLGFIWMGSFLPNSSQLGWMIMLSIVAFLFWGGGLGGFKKPSNNSRPRIL